MTIPVRNLYYLLCYAWNQLQALESVDAGVLDADTPEDLFGRVLRSSLTDLLRRGLDRGYLTFDEPLALPRGKIDVGPTLARCLHKIGRLHCSFDELSAEVTQNLILKATLRRLISMPSVDSSLRESLRLLMLRMGCLPDLALDEGVFKRVQLHRNNAHYGLPLHVCRLLFDNTIPDQADGGWKFRDFRGDDSAMGLLFEAFVRNFLRSEQAHFRVYRESIPWDATGTPLHLGLLPAMQTDISLGAPDAHVVIETKYYRQPLQRHFGKDTVRSGHLYQLFAYLKNLESKSSVEARSVGVLLYPKVEGLVHLDFRIHGHALLVRSLDLDQDWTGIREDLLALAAALESVAGNDAASSVATV